MFRVFIALFLVIVLGMPSNAQNKDLIEFYPFADSVADYPGLESDLVILRQKKMGTNHVSFLGYKDKGKVLIVVVTPKEFKDTRHISLFVQFDRIKPRAGKVTAWGYVYDRNGDGKIDYLALLGGAAAVKSQDLEEKDIPGKGVPMSREQIETFVSHCSLLFNHWADDNYDGKLDGVIHVDMDPFRDWVDRNLVVRSTGFGRKFDDVWAFRGDSMERVSSEIERTDTTVAYYPINEPPSDITQSLFREKSGILDLINRAAVASGLKKEDFDLMPKTEE